jgi:hypothetical protein
MFRYHSDLRSQAGRPAVGVALGRPGRVALRCLGIATLLGGCARPPGELYTDTSIRDLIAQGPGLYELHSPLDIPARGPNFVFLRQGKDMIVAAGDTLPGKIEKYMSAGDFSLVGRRMGQPRIWFAVDGVIVKGRLVERIDHREEWQPPIYEQFERATVQGYTPVDLSQYDGAGLEPMRRDLAGKKVRVTGTLRVEGAGPDRRYLVESHDLRLELAPVGPNLSCFLELVNAADLPLVVYGQVDRRAGQGGAGSGRFVVDFLRYSQDVLVRNVTEDGSA